MSKIVRRTLDLFELFEEAREPLSLSEIARGLRLPISSCHDMLRSLEERGYVFELGPRSGFYPTGKLARQASAIMTNDPFLRRSELEMRELSSLFGCSLFLARIEGTKAIYVLVLDAPGPWRFQVSQGSEIRSLYATSAGKAVLGTLGCAERDQVIDALEMVPFTPNTISDRATLKAEIEMSLTRGWCINREESVLTSVTASTVLRWGGGLFVLTLAGSSAAVEPRLEEIGEALISAAGRLETPR
jgi:DNA-binding IclR family transcriptional regulator